VRHSVYYSTETPRNNFYMNFIR